MSEWIYIHIILIKLIHNYIHDWVGSCLKYCMIILLHNLGWKNVKINIWPKTSLGK